MVKSLRKVFGREGKEMAHTTSKLLRGASRERQQKAKWEAMNKGQQVSKKGRQDHGAGWCTGGKGLDW